MEKTLKMFAVVTIYPKRLAKPEEPELKEAYIEMDEGCGSPIEMDEGCGSPYTNAKGVYLFEPDAIGAKDSRAWGGAVDVVVPCTVTFEIPK